MSDEMDPTTFGGLTTAVVLVVATAIFYAGHYFGGGAVLESARLKAEGAVLYQLVTIQSEAPSQDMLQAAESVCNNETSSAQASCKKDFLAKYGQTWVVNLVDGTRVLLRADQPGAISEPDAPKGTP